MQIQAPDDHRVPFAGGGVFHSWTLGAFKLAAAWRARNRCPPGQTTRTRTEKLLTSTTTRCRQATSVTLVAPTTGGHAWPGALPPYGPGPAGIDATALIARFFATTT